MDKPLTQYLQPDRQPLDIKGYERAGGYTAVRKALREMSPQDVQQVIKDSNLRGRGGAGFPTAAKWSFVPMGDDAPSPKYLVCNADEMEPGTFKDRLLMEQMPHQLVEGMIVASYALQARVAYIFLRSGYTVSEVNLLRAMNEAREAGYLGKNILGSGFDLDLHLHVSAGRYMCGEETGLLNALEGKRANPRQKPPFPPIVGLFGKPAIVNNVETLSNMPHIVNNGAAWFKGLSKSNDGGTKIFGVSGKVKRPGLWELPLGVTAGEIIEEHAGGMRDGLKLRGFLPGGASTAFLTAEHLDVAMDFTGPEAVGTRLGTGTMIILDDHTCPVGMVHNLEAFFARESCGWCTPCREGLPWTAKVLRAMCAGEAQEGDIDRLLLHSRFLAPGYTFCALAPGAAEPLKSALKHFREDFDQHVRDRRCPWKERG